ncbi:1-deoxy-D-xylulose-5-phosphate reductoisomerase [Rhizorhabdus phycosphaerae]|uniref:1-deoxy-D-xylulose-5-phosphate reductoisomerase n=1 Tax=Rhizorhabdus phycosphaerae TaxID=2711156 RepID=UPI0013EB5289|nr:1-deoxy-D-xylulose-5-phosphate reductoisomerase [Rhizorhabdus phycosphaerae]
MVKTISILGATGSIGTSTLDLIERDREAFRIVALTAQRDVAGLADAARRTRAELAVIGDPALYGALKAALAGSSVEVAAGEEAVVDAATREADWTMAAIVGTAGLRSTMAALSGGRTVALANKESLVSAGALMTDTARRHGATLLPVDSEHNAVFQCFNHAAPGSIRKVTLTASGGPFREWTLDAMRAVTPAQAVKHPNWSMGAKISVDSATLMNKGLELIEAFHLFPLEADQFDAVVHPQSVVHALVDYVDGSVLAQLGSPDMRTPIAHCLAWPHRMATPCQRLDLAKVGRLDFHAPDLERFPAFALAKDILAEGAGRAAILNAANEIAVGAFLDGRIGFLDIALIVRKALDRYDPGAPSSLEEVFAIDAEARAVARDAMETIGA